MKRHIGSVSLVTFATTLAAAVVSADAAEIRFTRLSVHGAPRCEQEAPPAVYVARRPNDQGQPTDDVTIVDGVLETDEIVADAVRISIEADLSVFHAGDVRDVSKMFFWVQPDGTRVPLPHELVLDPVGPTPFNIELARPIARRFLPRLPLSIPLRLKITDPAGCHDVVTSPEAAWRIVPSAGEGFGSEPGGPLVQLPDGATASDDAQLAVLYGCETMPRVQYALTGVAIRGRGRFDGARLKSVRVHEGTPDGPVVVEAAEDIALPAIYVGKTVIDFPDVLIPGDDAASREFWVVVTFADGETDIAAQPYEPEVVAPAFRTRTLFRAGSTEAFEAADGLDYAIDLLTDGRLYTAD